MRTALLATAALVMVGGTALAQNSTGSPASSSASNTTRSNTRSAIAPRLPIAAADATPDEYLHRAQQALNRGRTGEAQEALERAETRALDRSTPASDAATADHGPRVQAIRDALDALGRKDRAGAQQAIATALKSGDSDEAATGTMPMPAAAPGTAANGSTPTMPSTPVPVSTNTQHAGGNGVGSGAEPVTGVGGPGGSGGSNGSSQAN